MEGEVTSGAAPRVEIWSITPCHGRADLTRALLDSLAAASAALPPHIRLTPLLIDSTAEGSPAARQIEADCLAAGGVYLRGPESVRAKRNQAARHAIAAGAAILFFTDSDCSVTPETLHEHLTAYDLPASPFTQRPVGGAIGVTRFVGAESGAYRAAARTPFLDAFSFAERMPEAPFAPCTNLSVRAEVFSAVGGFPEGWQYRLGGDDTELGRRINNGGYAIVSRPRAVVYHSTSTWSRWPAVIERSWRWGRTDIPVRLAEPPGNMQWLGPLPLQTGALLLPVAALAGWTSVACLLLAVLVGAPALSAALRASHRGEWLAMWGAEWLLMLFHLGALVEAVRRLKPWLAYREIVTHPMQIGVSWMQRRRDAWVTCAMLLLWAAGSWLALRFGS